LALSQLVGEKWRERQATAAWAAEADLGLTEADLARARSVLRGHLADACHDPDLVPWEDAVRAAKRYPESAR